MENKKKTLNSLMQVNDLKNDLTKLLTEEEARVEVSLNPEQTQGSVGLEPPPATTNLQEKRAKAAEADEENLRLKKLLDSERSRYESELSEVKSQVYKEQQLRRRLQEDYDQLLEKLKSGGSERQRERELEHQLELARQESVAIVRMKDQVILDLKKTLDKKHDEIEYLNIKLKKSKTDFELLEDRTRRSVKALRIAQHLLEGVSLDATEGAPEEEFKKAQ